MKSLYAVNIKRKVFWFVMIPLVVTIVIGSFGVVELLGLQSDIPFWVMLVLTIAGLALIARTGYLMSHYVTDPILELKDKVDRAVSGEANVAFRMKNSDEIGEVASSFQKLIDRLDMFVQYVENLPSPMMAISTDFSIKYMNKAGAQALGKSQKELMGLKCYDQFKTGDCQTDNCALARAMRHDGAFSSETIAHPNGKELPILYSGAPLRDKQGHIDGASELVADITEIKNLQNYLSHSVEKMLLEMNRFADGDLTVKLDVSSEDDIGKLFTGFNKSVANIHAMIQKLQESIETTASAATQISSSSEELAAGVQEQYSQSSEVAAAVEEMTRTIIENSTNASKTAQAAEENRKMAEGGGSIVQETTGKMRQIANVVTNSATTVEKLGTSSRQIGEIISVIDDIADQTNLLALNAAIEAARAGEQGKGFAVVADEVRKLAERTTEATKQIEGMIKSIQTETLDAVNSMKRGTQEVEEGMKLADKAGEALEKIVAETQRSVDMINQIAAASEEQSATSEQISRNIESISTVSNESAAGVSQIARSADDLNRQTENLRNLVSQFRIDSTQRIQANGLGSRANGNHNGNGHQHLPVGLDFERAKAAHKMLSARLKNVINGKENIDGKEAADFHRCDLGKWYYSEGLRTFRGKTAFEELGKWHADLHKTAAEVVRLSAGAKKDEAKTKISQVEEYSKHVGALLDDLKRIAQVDA